MEEDFEYGHGAGVGGNRVVDIATVATPYFTHAALDIALPLLTGDRIVVGRFAGAGHYGAYGGGVAHELSELGAAGSHPEGGVRAGEAGAHGDRAAVRIKIEGGGWRGARGGGFRIGVLVVDALS